MRAIGNIAQEKQAQLFVDYLYSKGVESEIEPDQQNGGFLVWVHDDNILQDAMAELEQFKADADHPRYIDGAKAGRKRWESTRKEHEKAAPVVDARAKFGSGQDLAPPVFSFALVVISVLVFFPLLGEQGGSIPAFWNNLFINDPSDGRMFGSLMSGEVWRVFTPMFLHFSLIHILFNMMWIMQLGTMVERVHGTAFYALMVVFLALFSNTAQYIVGGPNFGGMSGVVFGIFGFAWMRGKSDPTVPYLLDKQTVIFMVIFMFLCYTGLIGKIANTAHTVGLVTGMTIGYLSARPFKFA